MIAAAVFKLFLAAYPAEFRREYGSEMAAHFAEDWASARDRGWIARVLFWLHLLRDCVLTAGQAQWDTLAQDLRSAAGSLRQRPFATGTLIVMFGVVVSANTWLLTVSSAMILHPLPYDTRGQMVYFGQSRSGEATDWQPIPLRLAQTWRDQSRTLTDLAFFFDTTTEIDGVPVHAFFVTPQVLTNLDVNVAVGHLPQGEDDAALLAPRLSERIYGAATPPLGAPIRLLGREYRVAGILKGTPGFPFEGDLWLPLSHDAANVAVFGRLKAGVSLRDAQSEGKEFQQRVKSDFPVQLAWLRNLNFDARYEFMMALLGAAFLAALLLTCADLATFQFAHIERRRRDIAIRMAVGASRGRLLRFLLTESLVIAAAAIAVSLPVTMAAISLWREKLDWWGLHRFTGWSAIRFGGFTVATAIGLCLASVLLGASLPSWRLVNGNVWDMLSPRRKEPAFARRPRLALLGAQFGLAILAIFVAFALHTEGSSRLSSRAVRFFDGAWQAQLPAKGPRRESAAILRQIVERLELAVSELASPLS